MPSGSVTLRTVSSRRADIPNQPNSAL